MSRFGESGQLIERLTFQYERDDRGNWTTRVISALDPATNALIPIREDHRIITYFEPK